jgi:hypothetical protein
MMKLEIDTWLIAVNYSCTTTGNMLLHIHTCAHSHKCTYTNMCNCTCKHMYSTCNRTQQVKVHN